MMDGFERLDRKVENPKKLDKVATKLTEEEFKAAAEKIYKAFKKQ